jgi:hypothetical protein
MFFSAMSLTASNTDAEGVIVWTAGSDFDSSISLTVFMFDYPAIVVPEAPVIAEGSAAETGNVLRARGLAKLSS